MANTKKRKRRPVKSTEKGARKQIKAIILLGIAVFLFAIVIIPKNSLGAAGLYLNMFTFGTLGFAAYVLPFVLGYIAVMTAMEKSRGEATTTIIFASLFAFLLDIAFEIFGHSALNTSFFRYVGQSYTIGRESLGGGVIGSFLAYPMAVFLGKLLAEITIVILLVVALMITTGTTLKRVGSAAKKTGEVAQEIHNETKEWLTEKRIAREVKAKEREAAKPKFNPDVSIDGMPDHPAVLNDLYKDKEGSEAKAEDAADIEKSENGVEKKQKKAVRNGVQSGVKNGAQSGEKIEIPSNMPQKAVTADSRADYKFPPLELLSETKSANQTLVEAELKSNCELLVNVLKSFGVEVRVTGYSRGPSVTRYEVQPSVGVRISKITSLSEDIALQLRAASVRIAPIPNKSAVGIEVPNTNSTVVGMRDIISSSEFSKSKSKILVSLGRDVSGNIAVCDLAKMPHLLVAGTTGSGKSVCLNSMIMSILYRATPDEVRFVMIDPKAVEFPVYNGIPHLLVPVVTDSRKAAGALGWAVVEMEKRYKILAENGVRNLSGYNDLCKKNSSLEPMPQIVIIIDEFADLMMVAGNEVESSVCRIAQKARAAGMHLVIATQRPSSDIFTGLIKSNVPSRIALSVASQVNSQIIIDMGGAEKLLGKGDMLYFPVGFQKPLRVQGCFVSDDEVRSVSEFIKNESEEAEYDESVMNEIERQAVEDGKTKKGMQFDDDEGDYDARIDEAIKVVVEGGMASTSLLQRKLKLGYARAARIMDEMEEKGIIGPSMGSKPREVLITKQQWLEMQNSGLDSVVRSEPSAKQLEFEDTMPETKQIEAPDEQPSDEPDNIHLNADDDEEIEPLDEDFLNSI